MGVVIILIIILLIAAIIGLAVYWRKLNNEAKKDNESGNALAPAEGRPNTVQSQIPIVDIADSMIRLSRNRFRMLIKCSSVNLDLKTEEERETFEQMIRRLLNSWDFPFAYYIQTRAMDNRKMLEILRNDINDNIRKFPAMASYAEAYYEYMSNITENLGIANTKEKFIIIGCDDAYVAGMSDTELQDTAFEMLLQKARLIVSGLQGLGVNADIVKTRELYDVLFQALNKSSGGVIDGLTDESFLALAVDSETDFTKKPSEVKIIANEFINKLQVGIVENKKTSMEEKNSALRLISALKKNAEFQELSKTGYIEEAAESNEVAEDEFFSL